MLADTPNAVIPEQIPFDHGIFFNVLLNSANVLFRMFALMFVRRLDYSFISVQSSLSLASLL